MRARASPRAGFLVVPTRQVYEAVFLMATRQFKRAAELLLDAIATFTRQGARAGQARCWRVARACGMGSMLVMLVKAAGCRSWCRCWMSFPLSAPDVLPPSAAPTPLQRRADALRALHLLHRAAGGGGAGPPHAEEQGERGGAARGGAGKDQQPSAARRPASQPWLGHQSTLATRLPQPGRPVAPYLISLCDERRLPCRLSLSPLRRSSTLPRCCP